jgi:hypothetical protein
VSTVLRVVPDDDSLMSLAPDPVLG